MIKNKNNQTFMVGLVKVNNVTESNLYRVGRELVLKGYNDDYVDFSNAKAIEIVLGVNTFLKIGDKFIVKYFTSNTSIGRWVTDIVSDIRGGYIYSENLPNTFNVDYAKKVVVSHNQLPYSFLIDIINNNIRINRNILIRTDRFDENIPYLENGIIEYDLYKESWHDIINNIQTKTKKKLGSEFSPDTFRTITKLLKLGYEIPQELNGAAYDIWDYVLESLEGSININDVTYHCVMSIMKQNYYAPIRKLVSKDNITV